MEQNTHLPGKQAHEFQRACTYVAGELRPLQGDPESPSPFHPSAGRLPFLGDQGVAWNPGATCCFLGMRQLAPGGQRGQQVLREGQQVLREGKRCLPSFPLPHTHCRSCVLCLSTGSLGPSLPPGDRQKLWVEAKVRVFNQFPVNVVV